MRLFSAAVKVSALLNSQRLVMNIANDIRLRLKHHFAALDGSLYLTVHDHPLCSDTSDDVGLRRDNERIAMQVARARRDNNYEILMALPPLMPFGGLGLCSWAGAPVEGGLYR